MTAQAFSLGRCSLFDLGLKGTQMVSIETYMPLSGPEIRGDVNPG